MVHDEGSRVVRGRCVTLENFSGYDSGDLLELFERGRVAENAPCQLEVQVTPTPNRTRGCATVGGKKVVVAVAPPSRFSKAKLARIYRHELRHIAGQEHEDMTERDLWSSGPEPEWSRGVSIRYRQRGESVRGKLR